MHELVDMSRIGSVPFAVQRARACSSASAAGGRWRSWSLEDSGSRWRKQDGTGRMEKSKLFPLMQSWFKLCAGHLGLAFTINHEYSTTRAVWAFGIGIVDYSKIKAVWFEWTARFEIHVVYILLVLLGL